MMSGIFLTKRSRSPKWTCAAFLALFVLSVSSLTIWLVVTKKSKGSHSFLSISDKSKPSQNPTTDTVPDIEKITQRRIETITSRFPTFASLVPSWLDSLESGGKWPASEVDLTTGCEARRANWPAKDHWIRLSTMSAAWRGGSGASENYVKNPALRASISSAMSYWFSRDIVNDDCLDMGNTPKCPCTDPENTLWNTNWFSNVILIPELVVETCLLLDGSLTTQELSKCTSIAKRSYGTFKTRKSAGWQTGANAIDISRIGMTVALLTRDTALLAESIARIQAEAFMQNDTQSDGIHADGSFGQHGGLIYNGNYGKDFLLGMVDLETEVAGTSYAAGPNQRSTLETLISGDKWMVFRNSITGVLHWDFSVLIRFLVFPASDLQPTRGTSLNLTRIGELGASWNSEALMSFSRYEHSTNQHHANAGDLVGNRMFFNSDYMVHRGSNFVSTLRLWSSRTKATECVNGANPFGFHLGSGVSYNYIGGAEYEDLPGAWDWNLIPGVTVDYGVTPLTCENTAFNGREAFVGGVSNGQIGTAAMRFTNPVTESLKWQKAWFYLPGGVIHLMIAGLSSKSSAPIYSVLDQRHRGGPIFVDGAEMLSAASSNATLAQYQTLWHGNTGYLFLRNNAGAALRLEAGKKSGNWQAIGTSLQPKPTFDIFTAYLIHNPNTLSTPVSYTIFPGTSQEEFEEKSHSLHLHTIQNDAEISAIYHEDSDIASVVFWNSAGGSVSLPSQAGWRRGKPGSLIVVAVDKNVALIYNLDQGRITISDPSQSITSVQVVVQNPPGEGQEATRTLTIELPQKGLAGQSVSVDV